MTEQERVSRERELKQAEEDLHDIRILKSTASFDRYLMRRFRQVREQWASVVLENDIPADQRAVAQKIYQAVKLIETMVQADERAAKAIIEGRDKQTIRVA